MSLSVRNSELNRSVTAPLARHSVEKWLPLSEYTDCKGLELGFGIKPGLAYDLLASGDIEGVSLKRRGQTRGKRLFKVESVRSFLEKQAKADSDGGEEVA